MGFNLKAGIAALRGKPESGKGSAFATSSDQMSNMFRVSRERTQTHADLDYMFDSSEIVSFGHKTYADRATGIDDSALDVLQVSVEPQTQNPNPANTSTVKKAQFEINTLIDRADLRPELWQIDLHTPLFGNEFREVLLDQNTFDIMGLKQLPEHTMWPNLDKMGTRIPGYQQRLDSVYSEAPINFAENEILHFTWGRIKSGLGTPQLSCARTNWNRFNLSMDMLAIARVEMQARYDHAVAVTPNAGFNAWQESIEAYKKNMTSLDHFNEKSLSIEKWKLPTSILRHFFRPDDGSGRGGIQILDPQNTQLVHLEDIMLSLDLLLSALGIPKRFFPFEGSTPKLSEGGGTAEDRHFACLIMALQMVTKRGLKQLFDLQLALKGIDPTSVRYIIRMADINVTDQLRAAQTKVALATTVDKWLKNYPEMRNELPVLIREFMPISDASVSTLSAVKVEEAKQEPQPPVANVPDDRTQLPGSGSDDRIKV